MRISDWSSDVCSSDLAFLNDIADTAPVRQQALTAERLAVEVHDARIGPFQPDQQAQDGGFAGTAGSDQCTHPPARQAQVVHIKCDGGAVALAGVCKLRLEEHTSELPSLMRISYAFF